MKKLTCFKAYDIRGKLGEELNEDIACALVALMANFSNRNHWRRVMSASPAKLKTGAGEGLQDAGVDVLDIGCRHEEIYFATFHLGADGGMVTASQ